MSEKAFNKAHLNNTCRLKKKQVYIQSVSGDNLDVKGQTDLEFRVGEQKFCHSFYVVKGLNRNIILGSDWMDKEGIRILFDLKKVKVGNEYVPYEQDIHIASLVRAARNTVLKPQTARVCEVKIKDSAYFHEGDLLEIQGTDKGFICTEPGLLVTSSLVSYKKGKCALLLVNNTNKTIRVRRGCVVGTAEAVRDVGAVRVAEDSKEGEQDLADLDVPSEFRSKVAEIVTQRSTLFASSDLDLGQTDTVQCDIHTGDHDPVKLRPYRVPLQDRGVVDKAIDEMLKAGVIRRSQSPWSFSLVIVSKKDGSKRLCVDFRKLNEITKKNSYPLPLIDDILSLLGKAKYFTSLDLKSGYWQVKMSEKDREKTAFACHRGLFEFNVMPFGLCNAPSVFMMLMNTVLEGLEGFACAYIDDILIFSETVEEHFEHLHTVLDRLQQHKLKLKLKKCQFFMDEIKYLGFVVGREGVKPDQEKVAAIRSMPPPTTVREVRSFMGMCSYYRRFIPSFSQIAEPIIALTKKYARFQWTKSCQTAFDKLKEKLTMVPFLAYPDPNKPYTLYTDVSDSCIGACLTQECDDQVEFAPGAKTEKPIFFLSHKLSDTQRKWSVIEKEAFAIHYALQKLDHYLHNAQFTIRTDHRPLKHLLNSPMQNKKIQMWALGIAGYNCQIEYIPGPSNILADLLSRPPESKTTEPCPVEDDIGTAEINDNTFEIGVIDSSHLNPKQFASYIEEGKQKEGTGLVTLEDFDMIKEQDKDADLVEIKRQMRQENCPKKIKNKYMLVEGVLYFLSTPDQDPKARLVIPQHLVPHVVRQYHDNNGHMGIDKTYDTIKEKYFWPVMYKGLYDYVSKCVTCQVRTLTKQRAPVQEMDVPPYPFAKVSLDVSGPYPRTLSGNKYIVAFVDHYSGWPEAFATPDKSADTIVQLLLEEIIPRHSCPLQIVTDNGSENENRVMRETLQVLNIDHVTTSFYHPQSNAKVERFHRTLHDVISKKLHDDLASWDLHLNQTLSAIRVSVSDTTQHSPFFLLHGRDPVLPLDNILKPRRRYMGEELHKTVLENQHKTFTQVYHRIKKAQKKGAKYANKGVKPVEFKVGDSVYVKNHQRQNKLDKKWKPFYRIVQQLSPVTFRVRNQLNGSELNVHAEHLREAKVSDWNIPKKDTSDKPMRTARLAVEPTDSSSESEVEVSPTSRLTRHYRRECDGSSEEDDIPLAELRRREQARTERLDYEAESVGGEEMDSEDTVDYDWEMRSDGTATMTEL